MKIYCHNFWEGFYNDIDCINFQFVRILFSKIDKNISLTKNINDADIYMDTAFGSLTSMQKYKCLKIHFAGEKYLKNYNYNIILSGMESNYEHNRIDIPLFVWYIYNTNYISKLMCPVRNTDHNIPEKFCIFVVSSDDDTDGCRMRKLFFTELNKYKKVDSYGKIMNNMNKYAPGKYWSEEYIQLLSQYKFVIAFENAKVNGYITEKIINPLLSNSIPIYYGSESIDKIFNSDRFIYLKNNNDIENAIDRIKYIDDNNEEYIKIVESDIFKDGIFPKKYELTYIQDEMKKLYDNYSREHMVT